MILIDAGPLIAILDANDKHHKSCLQAMAQLADETMLTTWPCFTEAIYLLGSRGGYRYQAQLWRLYTAGELHLHRASSNEITRMRILMETYQDTPMDLADASLVAVTESLNLTSIFTIDSHFYIYRLNNGRPLQVIP